MRRRKTTILATIVTAGIAATFAAAAAGATTGAATRSTTQVLVKFTTNTTASDMSDAIRGVGATEVGTVRGLGVHVLSVPAGAGDNVIAALSHRADVQYAEPDSATQSTLTPNDPSWGAEWGAAKINAPAAWDSTTGSSTVVIAILDTGAEYSHPDLQNRFVAGYDFVNNDADPTDDNGHGTAASGVAGAASNNAVGMAGMCWTCKLMPVKVLGADGTGDYSKLANGITWATDHGAQVISMSLAGSSASSTLQSAVQYAHNRGVVLVAAAGNYGTTAMNYPAAYAEVLGVAGTQSNDTLYSWSSYGSWVKVAAPGCDYATLKGGSYGNFCGTSAATPVVAGLAGLARSYQPSATNTQVETAIESSAVKIGTVVQYGRVDAAATLSALGSAPAPAPAPAPSTTTTNTFTGSLNGKNASKTFSVTSGAGTLSASLSFGSGSFTLQLVDSTGKVITSASGGSPVQLSSTVAAGTYKLVVAGTAKVSFTLKVTNPAP